VCSDLGTKDLRVGLGLSSPFGIGGREWSSTGLTRYQSVDSSITTVALDPTIAYRLLPNLSIAGGVDYLMAWTDSDAMVNQSLVGARDGKLEVSGHGSGWGYNVGLLFAPSSHWSLGFQYRSSITVNYEGSLSLSGIAPLLQPAFGASTFRSPIRTANTFPDVLGFGAAFRPTNKWTIALDAERYGWSSFGTVTTEVERQVPAAGITDQQTLFNWRDSWILRTGAEYRPTDRLSLRAGYCFVPNYVPNQTLNPSNPDSNQHVVSVGLGYKIRTIDLDFFYAAGFFEDRTVENAILSGRYEAFAHYFGVAIGKRF
jgi:long-chain fatty acid transport protein